MKALHKGTAVCPPQKNYRLYMFKQLLLPLFLGSEAAQRIESSSVKGGISGSRSIPRQKHLESKNQLLCGWQLTSTFIISEEGVGGAMAPSCTAPGWRQCKYTTRADQNGKSGQSECRTQPELHGMLVLTSTVKHLSVSRYPQLSVPKTDSTLETDICVSHHKPCDYKVERLLAPNGAYSKQIAHFWGAFL